MSRHALRSFHRLPGADPLVFETEYRNRHQQLKAQYRQKLNIGKQLLIEDYIEYLSTVRKLPRSRWFDVDTGERRVAFDAQTPMTRYNIQLKPKLGYLQKRIGWSRYPEHDQKARPLQRLTIRVWDRRLPDFLTTKQTFEMTPPTSHRLTVQVAITKLVTGVLYTHGGLTDQDQRMGGLSRAIVDASSLERTSDMTMSLQAFIKLAIAPTKRAAREEATGGPPAKKQKK